jgi:rubrerythrin
MQLDRMLDRARGLEERAAALYRGWAAATREDPARCALWTALAREEEEHARLLGRARQRLEPTSGWRTRIDGWEEALGTVDERLRAGERLGRLAGFDEQLCAALALEGTELDALRHVLLEVAGQRDHDEEGAAHTRRLAEAAERLSADPDVLLQAALLKGQLRLGVAS